MTLAECFDSAARDRAHVEALVYEAHYQHLLWVGMPPKLAATYVGGDWAPEGEE